MATLRNIVRAASQAIIPSKCARKAIASVLHGARAAIKKVGGETGLILPRTLPVQAKIGGFLSFLVPIFAGLSAAGTVVGSAGGIAKAVNYARAAKLKLEESRVHNKRMEELALGKGLYLKPYQKKGGFSLYLKPYPTTTTITTTTKAATGLKSRKEKQKKKFDELKLPRRVLTNFDLMKYAKRLEIPHFRGVFMRNELPSSDPRCNESAIINLDDAQGPGTLWVAYRKRNNVVIYFDSFGNLQSPIDLLSYLEVDKVYYTITINIKTSVLTMVNIFVYSF